MSDNGPPGDESHINVANLLGKKRAGVCDISAELGGPLSAIYNLVVGRCSKDLAQALYPSMSDTRQSSAIWLVLT